MQLRRTRQVLDDLKRATTDAQALLHEGRQRATDLRSGIGRRLADTTGRVIDFERAAVRRAHDAAEEFDRYAHEHPWRTVAAGAMIVAIAAVALSLLQRSRRD
jgi:ElaB/YqjD/DUF883 family membrane-anchored ribosome-binding protein